MPERWDVFHSDRLETERSLSTDDVVGALRRGDLADDDLVRPSGSLRWARFADSPEFAGFAPGAAPVAPPPPPPTLPGPPPAMIPGDLPPFEPASFDALIDEIEGDDELSEPPPPPEPAPLRDAFGGFGEFEIAEDSEFEMAPAPPAQPPARASAVLPDEEADRPDLAEIDEPGHDDLGLNEADDDEPAEEFTLSRNAAETVEELDLAAMVDVAFQLVLFFLVTASTVVFKTLEIPKPNEERPPEAATQSRAKTVDEMKDDYIIVKVDAAGSITIDGQAAPADRLALIDRLRAARDSTGRKAMLLNADFATRHKSAVLVFDVAGEIDLQIAIARPTGPN